MVCQEFLFALCELCVESSRRAQHLKGVAPNVLSIRIRQLIHTGIGAELDVPYTRHSMRRNALRVLRPTRLLAGFPVSVAIPDTEHEIRIISFAKATNREAKKLKLIAPALVDRMAMAALKKDG